MTKTERGVKVIVQVQRVITHSSSGKEKLYGGEQFATCLTDEDLQLEREELLGEFVVKVYFDSGMRIGLAELQDLMRDFLKQRGGKS